VRIHAEHSSERHTVQIREVHPGDAHTARSGTRSGKGTALACARLTAHSPIHRAPSASFWHRTSGVLPRGRLPERAPFARRAHRSGCTSGCRGARR
jgi:hypothetical protein